MLDYIELGKKIYNMENPREVKRCVVFVARCLLNNGRMKKLHQFFHQNELLAKVAEEYPFVYEQPTRAFFYRNSTFDERVELLEQHMRFIQMHFKKEVFLGLYNRQAYPLWESKDESGHLCFELWYNPGQRKEGILSIVLRLDEYYLYQMMIWIAPNKDGEWSLWIGAMQGPNMTNAKDVIRKVTRRCHSYRTKNFILHVTQEVAKALGMKHIYAVTNYGYYANTHMRMEKKLKTSFSDFWEESGGHPCEDKRFYELPMTEARKTMEEIPTRKRNYYRKRYALLDEVDASVAEKIKLLLK